MRLKHERKHNLQQNIRHRDVHLKWLLTDDDDALDARVLQMSRLLDEHAVAALDDGDLAGQVLAIARSAARHERVRQLHLHTDTQIVAARCSRLRGRLHAVNGSASSTKTLIHRICTWSEGNGRITIQNMEISTDCTHLSGNARVRA